MSICRPPPRPPAPTLFTPDKPRCAVPVKGDFSRGRIYKRCPFLTAGAAVDN